MILKKLNILFPILSLDKAYDEQELLLWIYKVGLGDSSSNLGVLNGISVEPKIDGCSIVLYYKDGILERALTRGMEGLVMMLLRMLEQSKMFLYVDKKG